MPPGAAVPIGAAIPPIGLPIASGGPPLWPMPGGIPGGGKSGFGGFSGAGPPIPSSYIAPEILMSISGV